MYVSRDIMARSRYHFYGRKAISIKHHGCMSRLIYPASKAHEPNYIVTWPCLLYCIFSQYHKQHDLRKKVFEHKISMCFYFFYNFY